MSRMWSSLGPSVSTSQGTACSRSPTPRKPPVDTMASLMVPRSSTHQVADVADLLARLVAHVRADDLADAVRAFPVVALGRRHRGRAGLGGAGTGATSKAVASEAAVRTRAWVMVPLEDRDAGCGPAPAGMAASAMPDSRPVSARGNAPRPASGRLRLAGLRRNSLPSRGAMKVSSVLAVPGVTTRRQARGSIGHSIGSRPASVRPTSRNRCSNVCGGSRCAPRRAAARRRVLRLRRFSHQVSATVPSAQQRAAAGVLDRPRA